MAPSTYEIEDCTTSVPALAASVTTSPVASTDVRVVAGPARHAVDARAAVENIVSGIAVSVFAKALPVAFTELEPVSVRFSTFAPSAYAIEL